MKRITVGVTDGQHRDLNAVKDKHGISMSAQIRELIRSRMDGGLVFGSGVKRSPQIWTKQVNTSEVISVNKELKEIFEKRKNLARN